jgi:glycosyltransferase 2 family protein
VASENSAPGEGRGRLRTILGLAVSAVSLVAVIWWATKQERPQFPTGATELLELGACLIIYAAATLLRGWRWHTILRRAHVHHAPSDAYGLVVVGYMGNNVLPARGGELLRVLLLGERSDGQRRVILGSIIAERFLDLITIVTLFTALTLADVASKPLGLAPLILAVGATVGAVFVLGLLKGIRRRGRLERFAEFVRPFAHATRVLVGWTGVVLASVTVVVWLLEGSIYWLVGDSLHLGITPIEALFLVVLTSFVLIIPSAPGYVGTYEAAVVFGLHAIGIEGGQAVAYALLMRFVLYVPITFVGLGLMLLRYGGLPRLIPGRFSRGSDPMEQPDDPARQSAV